MHRTIEVTLLPAAADTLAAALQGLQHVVGVARQRGASVQPAGCDVIVVHALNRGTDAVMRAVADAAAQHGGPLSVATAELASLSDPEHQAAIDRDVDEALWEEVETGMRHQGRVTPNFLALMALGGAIAAAGLVSHDPVLQTIATVAAAVVAPGFEPVSKVPLGLVLRRFEIAKLGLVSSLAGYAVLAVGAAAAFLALWGFGAVMPDDFFAGSAAKHLARPPAPDLLISFCGALAGVVGLMLVLPLLGVVMVVGETLGRLVTNPRLRARHRYARALRTRQASMDLDVAQERRARITNAEL